MSAAADIGALDPLLVVLSDLARAADTAQIHTDCVTSKIVVARSRFYPGPAPL